MAASIGGRHLQFEDRLSLAEIDGHYRALSYMEHKLERKKNMSVSSEAQPERGPDMRGAGTCILFYPSSKRWVRFFL